MAYSAIWWYSIWELTSEWVPEWIASSNIIRSDDVTSTAYVDISAWTYANTASSNSYLETVIMDKPVENEREATEEITRMRDRIQNDPFSLSYFEYDSMLRRIRNLEEYLEVESKKRERKNLLINKILQLCQNETKWL